MKSKTNIKLPLTDVEKANLRKNKLKVANILDFATDELEVLLRPRSCFLHQQKCYEKLPSVLLIDFML